MPALPKSLPRVCVALGFSAASQLSRAAEREYKDGNRFLEFRLDHLSDPAAGVQLIRAFRSKNSDAQILATCRQKQNHGEFDGSIEQQLALLAGAAEAGSAAIDIEIESAERAKAALPALREQTAVIVSYHNFEKTPVLAPVLRRLERIPADAYKFAVTARKPSDNLRVLELVREHRETALIALAMSETGVATRVLAPSWGCRFTYAAPHDNAGTAAGQVPATLMRSLYRCEKLGRQTRVYGVIADPVAHSKSPLIHNRALQARRIDAVYLPFLVPPAQLGDWMKVASALPVAGFSVTIPHKQRMLSHVDVIEPLAKRIGAINTVWRKAGKWRGTNTDTQGVVKPLSRHVRLAHASVLIAGYGGAARAAAIALCDAGAAVVITGRNLKRAQALARAAKAETVSVQQAQGRRYDALVHATPVGMSPASGECLFKDRIPADVVFDMVYNPHETLLLKRAKEQGCQTIYGSEMLLEQAACQFEIWTGESAPRAVMQKAFEQHA
jgi:3-dehydroquinate dehydratase / shikimate dehydrogenase